MYFLGTITGSSGANNNTATGVSGIGTFSIPPTARALWLQPSHSGVQFEFGPTPGFLTNAARGAYLDGPLLLSGPFRMVPRGPTGPAPCVSIYNQGNSGYVSVNVYLEPSS